MLPPHSILKPAVVATVFSALLLLGCRDKDSATVADGKPLARQVATVPVLDSAGLLGADVPAETRARMQEWVGDEPAGEAQGGVIIDYPLDGSLFPVDFTQPTFLWHDDSGEAGPWLVAFDFDDQQQNRLSVLVPGGPPPIGEIDMEAVAETNALYEGTEYQRTAQAWKPAPRLWEEIKRRSLETATRVTIKGISEDDAEVVSVGSITISTSKDPVGAPIFYRDVPLMPAITEPGKIRPLGTKAIPIIAWRLRDVSRPDSKLVLKGMHSCANCHSFSADGRTLGMDMDGPDGDKGMYTLKDIEQKMVIGKDDVITWNSFPDKPENHRTLGLFSRVSPDGRHVASTVNEDIFITNFDDYKILQVFFPTRGIIGIYSRDSDEFSPLPGADDPDYVQCNPVWSPDGQWVYFCRAKAFDAYQPDQQLPTYPNDPKEPQIRFDIYRVPFNDGKGGEAEPVAGASANGYSNTFPKISPDNQWLVWTRCKNGMLLRPDGRLFMVPAAGGEAREMNCNTPLMNSWHSFSPNGRWMVFSSKSRRPYTQAFLTHIDEHGYDSPAILVPNCTAANRAVNLPEFLNAGYDAMDTIEAPVVAHHKHMLQAERSLSARDFSTAADSYGKALEREPTLVRALVNMGAALSKLGQHELGLLYVEKALRVSPQEPYALLNGALLYLESDRPHMADQTLRKLMEVAPYFPKIREARALTDEALAKLNRDLLKAEDALIEEPENVGLNHFLAEVHRRAGSLEESLRYMEKAYELSQGNPVLGSNLAWNLATNPDDSVRDGRKAMELAKKAVDASGGKRPEPWDVLAAACAEVGEFEMAADARRRAQQVAKEINPALLQTWKHRQRLFPGDQPIRMPRDR